MGLYARIVDLDATFDRLIEPPVIVNDYDTSRTEEYDLLRQHTIYHYNKDVIDDGASCHCGKYTSVYEVGRICDNCHTPVQSVTDRPLTSKLWIRCPEEVTALINPHVWLILKNAMTISKLDLLEYFTNTKYVVPPDNSLSADARKRLRKVEASGLKRGLNNFIENFDAIMEYLFAQNCLNTQKTDRAELAEFLQMYRHVLFPHYIPIPSRMCFVVETNTSGTYLDRVIEQGLDAVLTVAGIRSRKIRLDSTSVQNRMAKAVRQLAEYYDNNIRTNLQPKPGHFRRHTYGTRSRFSARGVIDSISDPHYYDSLHLPWGMAVQLLKYHLINKLIKRESMSPNQALDLVYTSVLKYNPLIDQLFQELIAESPEGRGLPVTFNRN